MCVHAFVHVFRLESFFCVIFSWTGLNLPFPRIAKLTSVTTAVQCCKIVTYLVFVKKGESQLILPFEVVLQFLPIFWVNARLCASYGCLCWCCIALAVVCLWRESVRECVSGVSVVLFFFCMFVLSVCMQHQSLNNLLRIWPLVYLSCSKFTSKPTNFCSLQFTKQAKGMSSENCKCYCTMVISNFNLHR